LAQYKAGLKIPGIAQAADKSMQDDPSLFSMSVPEMWNWWGEQKDKIMPETEAERRKKADMETDNDRRKKAHEAAKSSGATPSMDEAAKEAGKEVGKQVLEGTLTLQGNNTLRLDGYMRKG
jgi:hypothetical protein